MILMIEATRDGAEEEKLKYKEIFNTSSSIDRKITGTGKICLVNLQVH